MPTRPPVSSSRSPWRTAPWRRRNTCIPGVLDTLAEALFQSGNRLGAILTIDEAIRLVPDDPYFSEQRRRFTGERAADDRPPPPGSPSPSGSSDEEQQAPQLLDPEAPRLTI